MVCNEPLEGEKGSWTLILRIYRGGKKFTARGMLCACGMGVGREVFFRVCCGI